MKKYVSIVLILSVISLPFAKADTTVQNDNTSGEVEYADHQGTDQLNPLKRPSYHRTDFSLYMSPPLMQTQSEEDTTKAVDEEEQEGVSPTKYKWGRGALGCLIGAVGLVVTYVLVRNFLSGPDLGTL